MSESAEAKSNRALADAPGCLFYGVAFLIPPLGVWWAYKMPQREPKWKRRLGLSALWFVFFVGVSLNSYFERQAGEGATTPPKPTVVESTGVPPEAATLPASAPVETSSEAAPAPPAETPPEPAPAADVAKVEAPAPPEPTPDEKLLAALIKEVGKRKIRADEYKPPTGKSGELTVAFNVSSFFSKFDMKSTVTDILRTLKENGFEGKSVYIKGYAELVDKFGNVTNEVVVKVGYTRETIQKINFDNFLLQNVFDIAEKKSLWLHPAAKE